MAGGDERDIYCWCTSLPDSAQPPVANGAVRAETSISFEKIGFCKDLPPDRKIRTGIYYRSMAYTDFKIHWMLVKLGRSFIYSGSRSYMKNVDKYIKENYESLKEEVASSALRTN